MFTSLEIAGLVAFIAVVFGVGFILQRLDSAIAGSDEPAGDEAPDASDAAGPAVVIKPRNAKRRRRTR